jgi:hypothetical protein
MVLISEVPASNLSPETDHPEGFRGSSQTFHTNDRIVHLIRPWPLPFISFTIHYSYLSSYDSLLYSLSY